jgi:DHA1 family bicyclomycin/chloramphenicol resistance-like MFS transporter
MQEWAGIFGASQASVQLTFSGYVIAYGGLQLLYGPLSDRLGRKNILLFGLFVAGVGSVLAALAPNLGLLTLARVLQGAGSAAGMVVGRAMVQDLFQGPARTRVMAYIGMTMGLCPPLATIIGGQLHVRLGWQSNFVLIAVLAAVLFVAAWRGLPDHQKTTTVQPHWLRAMWASYARLAREPAFILYVALLSMITATFYTFLSGAPIVLGSYGVGPEGIGYYIMSIPLAYIVGNYLTSHLVHRTGERPMMRLGQALTLSGVALMLGLALAGWHSPLAFALPLILLGIGHGFLVPPALAGTVSLVPALAGSAAAVAGLMQQVMGAVGGFTVGLFTHEGAVNLGLLMVGFSLCAALAQWLLHRRPS